ncbi:MAG: hypothetical protein HC896_14380 [Bacteroidales bacterium]|nr:hypothetical protein [Bacteroidales bacterium]
MGKATGNILILILFCASLPAQKITQGEYFIDADPGHGKAVPFTLEDTTLQFSIDLEIGVQDIEAGFHRLYTRLKNDSNVWGNTYSQRFYAYQNHKTNPAALASIEYFIDDTVETGKANAIFVDNAKADSLEFVAHLDVSALPVGVHTITARAVNGNGKRAAPYQGFYLEQPVVFIDIVQVEYAFDDQYEFDTLFIHDVDDKAFF